MLNKKILHSLIVLYWWVLLTVAGPAFADKGHPHYFVVSGVVVNSGNGKTIQGFVNYLSQQTGYPMQVIFVDAYEKLSSILREHPDSIAWTCGAPFVEDAKSDGQQLISVPLFNGVPMYHSIILARKGSEKHSLSDFKGDIFVYSDPRSNSGYVSPSYALKQQGIDIKKHFRVMIHAGAHERSIKALLGGLADVAAVDEYVWAEYVKEYPQAGLSLVEVEKMGPYPFTPIVAGARVSSEKIIKLKQVLADMNESEQGKKHLDKFGLDGFVGVDKDFFMPIENMLEAVSE